MNLVKSHGITRTTRGNSNLIKAYVGITHFSLKPIGYILVVCLLLTLLLGAFPANGFAAENRKASLSKQKNVKPKPEPNGKFLISEYKDPGEQKTKLSFFAQFLNTVISIIKYIFYFALVLLIGFLAIYGTKLLTTKYGALTNRAEGLLNVLEIRYLAPGKAICLVEVAGKILVLGLAGNNISPLSEFVENDKVESLTKAASQKPQPLQPFQSYLERFTKRFSNPATGKQWSTSKERYGTATENRAHWKENLRSAGENINTLLKEIKKHDKKTKDSGSSFGQHRGEDTE